MSADNGIYILKTLMPPKKTNNYYESQNGYEYRVAHCQAIENIDYSDLYLPLYFGDSPVFTECSEAMNYAKTLENEIGWTEYGIEILEQEVYFPNMTVRAAAKALDCYIGAEPLDYLN